MADFELLVNAKLQGIESLQAQLNSICKNKTINITANTDGVITKLNAIQEKLNKLNGISINFGSGNNSGLGQQQRQIDGLSESYTRLVNLARKIGSLEVKFEGLNTSRNSQQLDEVIRQYETVSNEYNALRATLSKSIEPAGFKQVDNILADTASKIRELHAQAADTAAFSQQQKAIKDVDIAYRDMLSIIGRIGTTKVQMAGLDDTSNQFVLLQNRLEDLNAKYKQLHDTFGGKLNAGQAAQIEGAFAAVESRVENIQAHLSDVNLKNLEAQIENTAIKLQKLNPTNNVAQIETLKSQLGELRQQYESLITDTANPNVDATGKYAQVIENIKYKLEELDAIWKDKQASMAQGIELKVNTGEFDANIAQVTAQYEQLGNTGHPKLEQIRADIEQLTILQQKMANSGGDVNALLSSYEQYKTTLQRVKSSLKTVSSDAKTFVSSLQISQLDNRIQVWAEQNSRATKMFGASITDLRQRLATLQQSGHATASDLDAIRIEFEKIQSAAISAGKTGSTFGNIWKQSAQTLMRYFSVSTLIYKAIASIKQMVQNVIDVDTAMTGLYRVTNLTASQYDALFNKMAASAKQYGAELTDIINATTTWVKLGFAANVAQELGNITTMYQHVTNLDTKTSVDNLVTAYKGFQDQLDSLYKGDTAQAVSYVADIFDKLGKHILPMRDYIG